MPDESDLWLWLRDQVWTQSMQRRNFRLIAWDSNLHISLCIDSSVLPIFLPANVEVKVKYSFHVSFYMVDRHKSAEIHYCILMFSSNRQAIYDFVKQISGNILHK
jgi:hypothetical protein